MYEETKKLVFSLQQKLQDTKKRFNALDEGYWRLKKNYVYRVIHSKTNSSTPSKNELVAMCDLLSIEKILCQNKAK